MSQKTTLLMILSTAMVLVSLSGCITDTTDPPETVGTDAGTGSDDGNETTRDDSAGNGTTNQTGSLPTATLTATVENATAPANVSLLLEGNDTDGDALAWTLDWDGDGTVDENGTTLPKTVDVTFQEAGNYTALLQVTDKDGTVNATANITIEAPSGVDDGLCHRPDAMAIGPLWLDDRTNGEPDLNHWIYEESNGIAGLQVGGEGEADEYLDCANPDTLLF